jgi:hypothetical protein
VLVLRFVDGEQEGRERSRSGLELAHERRDAVLGERLRVRDDPVVRARLGSPIERLAWHLRESNASLLRESCDLVQLLVGLRTLVEMDRDDAPLVAAQRFQHDVATFQLVQDPPPPPLRGTSPSEEGEGNIYSICAASSASSLRSPFRSVMWPGHRALLEALDDVREPVRGRVDVRVVDLVRVARQHDLRPSPARVMTVFTSCGVRFCASSITRYWRGSERPGCT